MTSKEYGIEEARKRLGDLVTAAQQGSDIILTRHGRPAARLIPIKEPAMPTTSIPPLSDGTRAAVANLVDYEIAREYGKNVTAEINGARTVALGGLKLDLRDQFVSINGHDRGLDGYAESTLRILVRDGLAARVCQCSRIRPASHAHPHAGLPCAAHYEADVPPIDGALLCGGCHVAEYQARS